MKDKILAVTAQRIYKEPCVIRNIDEVREYQAHKYMESTDIFLASDPFVKGALFLVNGRLSSGNMVSVHWHEMEEYYYFISGHGTLINTDGSEVKVGQGDGMYLVPNGMHEVRADKGEALDFLVYAVQLPNIPYRHGQMEPFDKITITPDLQVPGIISEGEDFEEIIGICEETLSKELHIVRNKDAMGQVKEQGDATIKILYSREDPFIKSLIYFGVAILESGKTALPHWHDFEEFWFFTKGKGTLLDCDGKEKEVSIGDTVYITPNGMHGLRADKGHSLEYVVFANELPGIPYRPCIFEPLERYAPDIDKKQRKLSRVAPQGRSFTK
ncbi:MAG: cupin domain-containing protein [Actinobacteria bacterium]|nr:cupin domain-containing protein [Actinomycetota bacterium]